MNPCCQILLCIYREMSPHVCCPDAVVWATVVDINGNGQARLGAPRSHGVYPPGVSRSGVLALSVILPDHAL